MTGGRQEKKIREERCRRGKSCLRILNLSLLREKLVKRARDQPARDDQCEDFWV